MSRIFYQPIQNCLLEAITAKPSNSILGHILQLDNLKALCADMESDMTLDEATAKQTDLRTKLSTLRNRVKNSQKKLNLHNKKMQTLGDKKNKIKEELLNVQKKVCNFRRYVFLLVFFQYFQSS